MSLSKIQNEDNKIQKFKGGLNTDRDYTYNLFNMDIVGKIYNFELNRKFSKKIRDFNSKSGFHQ
jgi:hypothetical protein